MTDTPKTIRIDGQDYTPEQLNEEARAQLNNLRITDQEIARMQAHLAIAQTARAAYARALRQALAGEAQEATTATTH